jgi:acetyl-CoA synthetase
MMINASDVISDYDLNSMQTVLTAGEPVGEYVVDWVDEELGATIHEVYGQTEAAAFIGTCTGLGVDRKEGKIGVAGPGHDVTILDPETAEPTVPTGEVGEIALRYEGNPLPFTEYWGLPEKTTEKKLDSGWMLTEDLGTVDEDGYFEFVSRKDDVILSAGYRIGPGEIEETLENHEAVLEAGVIGIPDGKRGEVPKAFVTLSEGVSNSPALREELTDVVRERLAKYEYPREIEVIDEFPKTTTGKIQRSRLEDREEKAE